MNIYVCDGSPESFFTAVFDGYKDENCVITSESDLQISLDSNFINVEPDFGKIKRITDGILKYDRDALDDILISLRSCDSKKEQIALGYIKTIFKMKMPVKNAFNLPEIADFNDLLNRVTYEIHKIKGFLRFMESESGAFYAPYSPDNDITDLLMPHFVARFNAQKFVIHDIKRKIAGLYNGSDWIMCPLDQPEIVISDTEKSFESLWKKYYSSVNIESRPHEKQMKGYMPVRYWKFLPEKRDSQS
ncbi:MAG: TIGR03915 family putative DNA repair protein [Clostridiales bacterium]|nr:TIGR03915 family putative DNA repair protein [Clostridiales bacterium]